MDRIAPTLAAVGALPGGEALVDAVARGGGWFVGGVVRDAVLGRPLGFDVDVVTEGDAHALAAQVGELVEAHERFGTASASTAEGVRVDVARARTETYERPGALPDVRFATVAEDLARRDFTVNAIAVRADGTAFEAVEHAFEDLRADVLRVLHERSFVDDPTRALRLARYAVRLGASVAPGTAALARLADLSTVSGSRVGAETLLLLAEDDPVAALAAPWTLLGLLEELAPDTGAARRGLALLPEDGSRDVLVLASAEPSRELLDGLGLEAAVRDRVLRAAQWRSVVLPSCPSEVAVVGERLGIEGMALVGRDAARRWLEQDRFVVLTIGGHDLLEAGVEAGPAVGAGLRRALAARLDGEVGDDRDAQLRVALGGG